LGSFASSAAWHNSRQLVCSSIAIVNFLRKFVL
jgi:hypothetical protein